MKWEKVSRNRDSGGFYEYAEDEQIGWVLNQVLGTHLRA